MGAPLGQENHIVNPELLDMAQGLLGGFRKRAFVPGGDPSQGGAPPGGGDPSQGGGMPPGAMPPGGGGPPPGAGGGMPPGGAPPDAGGNPLLDQIMQKLTALEQGAAGAGGAGGAAALKPKIDVNVEIMAIKNMLAKVIDFLGVPVGAQDLTATSDKLNQMASNPGQEGAIGGSPAGMGGGAGGPGGGQQPAIGGVPPMGGVQPAGVPGQDKVGQYHESGHPFGGGAALAAVENRAQGIMRMRRQARALR